jgi:hypothetical protein
MAGISIGFHTTLRSDSGRTKSGAHSGPGPHPSKSDKVPVAGSTRQPERHTRAPSPSP